MVVGTALSVKGSLDEGKAQAGAHMRTAAQYEEDAKQAVGIKQRQGFEQQREAKLLASRALAVAAAGGGSASDVTVSNIIGDIKGEGAYRMALSLYEGKTEEKRLYAAAAAERQAASDAKRAARNNAMGSLFGGLGRIAGKL